MAALRAPLRHPVCVEPGALLTTPPGTAEPPIPFVLLQERREAILIKGACNILRVGICCSVFRKPCAACSSFGTVQALSVCLFFPATNIFLSSSANLLPLHPRSFCLSFPRMLIQLEHTLLRRVDFKKLLHANMHTKQILKASYPASIPSREQASCTMFCQRSTRNNVV